jgi:hypothetical protein
MANTPSTLSAKHAAYKVSVDLEVNGKTVPVVEAVVEFVLNQIPIARVVVPSGITFNNANASGGNQLLDPQDLTGRKPAKLRVKGSGKPHPNGSKATPQGDGEWVLFDGYVLSSSADFSTSGVATTVVLVHWLYDLDLASFASGDFDKNAPDSWFTIQDSSLPNSDHVQPTYIAQGQPVADSAYVSQDWWEDIIKPAAKYKASQPLRRFRTSNTPSNNAAAIAAMDRIYSKGKMKLNSNASSALQPATLVTHAINDVVGMVIFTGNGGSTAFEKFISLASGFGAVLAPRVDECLMMAYNPLAPVDVYIPDSECDFGGSSANPALLPVGAIMYGGGTGSSIVNKDKSVIESNFIGQYVAPLQGKVDGGPFIVFPTPEYLSNIRSSQVPDGQFKSKVGIVPITSPKAPNTNATQQSVPKGFADELAKSYYLSKVFSTKTQDVMCGFRLDVAPGDCVKIYRSAGSASGANVSGLAKNWIKRGIVESVTYTLSAASNKIMTSYRLRHLMESQDLDMFGISDSGEPAALFLNKPTNAESPLKKV